MRQKLQLITHPTIFLIFLLGFSSGLPLALTGATLQFWYNAVGVSLVGLGLLNLIGQPYTFKFLWAPLMDRFSWPVLGRRRGWLLCTQLLLIATLAYMAFLDPQIHAVKLGLVAIFAAFLSASQDVAVDAYRTDTLTQMNLGVGNAFYTAGYRIAMLVSGGLALILAGYFGFKVTYLVMAGLMSIGVGATLLGREPPCFHPPTTLEAAITHPFKNFLQKPKVWLILLFILLYKLGDAFAFSVLGPFLSRAFELSLKELGSIYKTVGLAATLIGVFAGGGCLSRLGLYRALMVFGVLQGVSTLCFLLLLQTDKSYPLLVFAIALENVTAGMATIAFLSFLMNLCDHRYTATQFALLSSLSAMGRVYIGPLGGYVAQHYGWGHYFVMGFLLSLPGLFLLWWLQNKVEWPFATQVPAS